MTTTEASEFWERLEILRDQSGQTQPDFARLFNLTAAAFGNYKRGALPNSSTLITIADRTGCSLDWPEFAQWNRAHGVR